MPLTPLDRIDNLHYDSRIFQSREAASVLCELLFPSYSVEIAEDLNMPQQTVHWHIQNLEEVKLIKKSKRTQAQYYEVDYDVLIALWYAQFAEAILDELQFKKTPKSQRIMYQKELDNIRKLPAFKEVFRDYVFLVSPGNDLFDLFLDSFVVFLRSLRKYPINQIKERGSNTKEYVQVLCRLHNWSRCLENVHIIEEDAVGIIVEGKIKEQYELDGFI
ncbi:MAG: helix-turn-helix domain-containing protein [Candidatus Micrarchaeota archaeon]